MHNSNNVCEFSGNSYHHMSIPGGSRLQFFQQLSTLSLPGIVHYRSALRVHSCSAVSLETLILLRVSMAFYLTKYWSDTWQLNTHAYKNNCRIAFIVKTHMTQNSKFVQPENSWTVRISDRQRLSKLDEVKSVSLFPGQDFGADISTPAVYCMLATVKPYVIRMTSIN